MNPDVAFAVARLEREWGIAARRRSVLALVARRFLDSGSGRERHGLTAEPLFTDSEGRSGLEVAANVGSFAPAARTVARPGFEGGGGRVGGGGASSEF